MAISHRAQRKAAKAARVLIRNQILESMKVWELIYKERAERRRLYEEKKALKNVNNEFVVNRLRERGENVPKTEIIQSKSSRKSG